MNIVKGTVKNWQTLDSLKKSLRDKGFTDVKDDVDGCLLTILDDENQGGKEFLKVIVGSESYQACIKHFTANTPYLLLIKDFEEFLFVKQEISTLGKLKIRKFKFTREDTKRSSLEKLDKLEFNDLNSFENLFDTKPVVEEFYDEYKKWRTALVDKIQGIDTIEDRDRYAQILFDRLIFLHFIQEKNFLADDKEFLTRKYAEVTKEKGNYYQDFLKFLFFEVLNKQKDKRKSLKHAEFSEIPFLNGGLFREHRIEKDNQKVWISNEIFGEILEFLKSWYWYADENSDLGEDTALSPEILGHIFEKTITGQKEKGAYYTPEVITSYISENTIFPYCLDKLNEKFKTKYDNLQEVFKKGDLDQISYLYFDILKKIAILDSACGSGAFLLAAQRVLVEIYKECWETLKNSHSSEIEKEKKEVTEHKSIKQYFKRAVIANNLYGVDIEEGAIEICRLRLWLSLVSEIEKENAEPLLNIDYNIMQGNSLLGFVEAPEQEHFSLNAWIPTEAEEETGQTSVGADKTLKEIMRLKGSLVNRYKDPNDPETEKLKREIENINKTYRPLLNKKLQRELTVKKVEFSEDELTKLLPFHWGFEFYGVFDPEKPIEKRGFDIIIGNPPWETLRPKENEFFPTHKLVQKPGLFDGKSKPEKRRIIAELLKNESIRAEWMIYQEVIKKENKFIKTIYHLQTPKVLKKKTGGDLDLSKIFLERSSMISRKEGYLGYVIPNGLEIDLNCTDLRKYFLYQTTINHFYDFENRNPVIFDNVHREFRIIIFITQFKESTGANNFSAVFKQHDPHILNNISKKAIDYPIDLIEKLSPDTYTIFGFNEETEVELTKKIYSFPQLGSNKGKDWQVQWCNEFHMTNDSGSFTSTPTNYILLEGRSVNRYDYMDKKYVSGRARKAIWKALAFNEKQDWRPQWWIKERYAKNAIKKTMNPSYKLVSCDVTTPNTPRTILTTITPKNIGCGNSLNVLKVTKGDEIEISLGLCGLLNSMVLDFIARLKIKLHANMHVLNSLPVPEDFNKHPLFNKLVTNTVQLVSIDNKYEELLKSYNKKRINFDERIELIIENEAIVGKMYNLNAKDMKYLAKKFKKYVKTIPNFEKTLIEKFEKLSRSVA